MNLVGFEVVDRAGVSLLSVKVNRVDREVVDRVNFAAGEVLIPKAFSEDRDEDREAVGAAFSRVNWRQIHLATGSIDKVNCHFDRSIEKQQQFRHLYPKLMAKN
jgi:hypothetical protein